MTDYPLRPYPPFAWPDAWKEAWSLDEDWQDDPSPKPAQLTDDALQDHDNKHADRDHPWCKRCEMRSLSWSGNRSPVLDSDALEDLQVAVLKSGLDSEALWAAEDALGSGRRTPEQAIVYARRAGRTIAEEHIEALTQYLLAVERHDRALNQAERVTYARAVRWFVLHNAPPVDTFDPAADGGLPAFVSLREFLDQPDDEVRYLIEELWPSGGRVVCSAQHKSGKSTLLANLLRSLCDNEPFLDRFPAAVPERRIALIDDELAPNMLRRWLRDQGIAKSDDVALLPLRGRVASFNILDPAIRTAWADKLREQDASVVMLDCLRPVLDSLGLSEDKDAGRFLVAFDALLLEAGATEAVIVHHAGHQGERSRGDSRLRDWPDVEWLLLSEKGEDGEGDRSGPRFFKAYGRDVDVPEAALEYDHATRRLTFVGGSRKTAAATKLVPEVIAYLADHPGSSGRQVEAGLAPQPRADVRTALKQLVKDGRVDTAEGAKRAVLHFLSPQCASAPQVRQRTEGECASALKEQRTALAHLTGTSDGALEHRDPPLVSIDKKTA